MEKQAVDWEKMCAVMDGSRMRGMARNDGLDPEIEVERYFAAGQRAFEVTVNLPDTKCIVGMEIEG